jgi:hypothetical protein
MDRVADIHLQDTSIPMESVGEAMESIQTQALAIAQYLDRCLREYPDIIIPEVRSVLERFQEKVLESLSALGPLFYRRYIPIRFVQFVDSDQQTLTDERIQYNIDIANRIFFPARIRFVMRANLSIVGSEFTSLYLRDSEGNHVKDADDHYIPVDYQWPMNVIESPLIQPLVGASNPNIVFIVPPNRTEHRYFAQMRAGTYYCPNEELLVYINQGPSNGGQYPWYSRIIGMTSWHMANPDNVSNKTTFAHEVGHYLGLPHTFPAHKNYYIDYDLARMIDPPTQGDPPPMQRRYYEPHENLVDVETGGMAPLSMFWDQVFAPVDFFGESCQRLFFNSRWEAALWEQILQPIEQWGNGTLCGHGDDCCDAGLAKGVRMQMMVGAGCPGSYGSTTTCNCQAVPYCTGNPDLRAFSKIGSAPNRLQLNLMAYGYRMHDGTDTPAQMIEGRFLSESQLEQIDRVLIHDVQTKFFNSGWGRRPELGDCTTCHTQLPR